MVGVIAAVTAAMRLRFRVAGMGVARLTVPVPRMSPVIGRILVAFVTVHHIVRISPIFFFEIGLLSPQI